MFGHSHHYGGVAGGQAELARVPKANVGPRRIRAGLDDEQVLFLGDILPTGYQAVLNGAVGQGGSVAIFGAGPVGQMAAARACWARPRFSWSTTCPAGSGSGKTPTA